MCSDVSKAVRVVRVRVFFLFRTDAAALAAYGTLLILDWILLT